MWKLTRTLLLLLVVLVGTQARAEDKKSTDFIDKALDNYLHLISESEPKESYEKFRKAVKAGAKEFLAENLADIIQTNLACDHSVSGGRFMKASREQHVTSFRTYDNTLKQIPKIQAFGEEYLTEDGQKALDRVLFDRDGSLRRRGMSSFFDFVDEYMSEVILAGNETFNGTKESLNLEHPMQELKDEIQASRAAVKAKREAEAKDKEAKRLGHDDKERQRRLKRAEIGVRKKREIMRQKNNPLTLLLACHPDLAKDNGLVADLKNHTKRFIEDNIYFPYFQVTDPHANYERKPINDEKHQALRKALIDRLFTENSNLTEKYRTHEACKAWETEQAEKAFDWFWHDEWTKRGHTPPKIPTLPTE